MVRLWAVSFFSVHLRGVWASSKAMGLRVEVIHTFFLPFHFFLKCRSPSPIRYLISFLTLLQFNLIPPFQNCS